MMYHASEFSRCGYGSNFPRLKGLTKINYGTFGKPYLLKYVTPESPGRIYSLSKEF